MVRGEHGIYITVSGLAQDGRTHGGGEHQVLGRSEWIGGCVGGGIKGACLVAARLLCVFCLSCFSFSVCRRGFQAVLRTRPSSLFILFGCHRYVDDTFVIWPHGEASLTSWNTSMGYTKTYSSPWKKKKMASYHSWI
jgi:hypothetical protein